MPQEEASPIHEILVTLFLIEKETIGRLLDGKFTDATVQRVKGIVGERDCE